MRLRATPTARATWEADAPEALEHARRAGLGIRPPLWWRYESGRPDLEDGAAGDAYVGLPVDGASEPPEGPALDRARARLAHLALTGELTDDERRRIAERPGARGSWRREVLSRCSRQAHP